MTRVAWTFLALAGLASYATHLGYLGRTVRPDFDQVPSRLGLLEAEENLPLTASSFRDVVPDSWLYRRYRTPAGGEGYLFLSYFERTQSWHGGPHDPVVCYEAAGWTEKERRILDCGQDAKVRVSHLRRGARRTTIAYWTLYPGCPPQARLWPSVLERLGRVPTFRADALNVCFEFPGPQDVPGDTVLKPALEALLAALQPLLES